MPLFEYKIKENSSKNENLLSILSAALDSTKIYNKTTGKEDIIHLVDMQQQNWNEDQVKQSVSEIRNKFTVPKEYKLKVSGTTITLDKKICQ